MMAQWVALPPYSSMVAGLILSLGEINQDKAIIEGFVCLGKLR